MTSLKVSEKHPVQASVSKDTVIRVLKNRNQKTEKKTRRPESLSVRDKRRIRRTTHQLIRQDELVTSHIIKNKIGVTASRRTICRTTAKQDFSYKWIKKQLPLTPKHREERLKFSRKHIVKFTKFKQVIFTAEKRFCLDGPDNISLSVEHRGDSVIAPYWMKCQMGGARCHDFKCHFQLW